MSNDTLWEQLQQYRHAARLPQALLITGNDLARGQTVALDFARLLLCDAPTSHACGQCRACKLLENHPDYYPVHPEKNTISIDQVRLLGEWVIQTSSYGRAKVVVISPAEAMPVGAMNSLLKLLEEPPQGVIFLVLTRHAMRVLPTVRSRCQVLQGYEGEAVDLSCLPDTFVADFLTLLQGSMSPIVLAAQWSKVPLVALLQAIQCVLMDSVKLQWSLPTQLLSMEHASFAQTQTSATWYRLLDACQAALRLAQRNVPLHQELVLNELLLTYRRML